MKTQEQLVGVHILSLIGEQGTGKTTIASRLAAELDAQFIEASQVVSEVTGEVRRAFMWTTNARTQIDPTWLGCAIEERIIKAWQRYDGEFKRNIRVILSGVRELEVHDYLKTKGANIEVVSLWAPENERFIRVKNNGKVKSYKDFVKHGQAELDVGLSKLLFKYSPQYVTTYYSIDEVIKHIMEKRCSLLT